MLVAEGNGLVGSLALPGDPRRALQLIKRHSQGDNDQPCYNQTRPGQRVRAAVKNLRHECVPASSKSLVGWRVSALLFVQRLLSAQAARSFSQPKRPCVKSKQHYIRQNVREIKRSESTDAKFLMRLLIRQ